MNAEQAFCAVQNIQAKTTIANIDTGIDPNHPDLSSKIVNPINFTSSDPNDYIDENGHGTFTAGIAAAITNNKMGIAGASYNTANIIPIRAGDANGRFTLLAVVQGIFYAISQHATVINMSIGFSEFFTSMQLAINQAWEHGIILVASAGNNGNEQPNYPAACNYVLAVSATNLQDTSAFFSTWGLSVGITAPGQQIVSTTPTYPTNLFDQTFYSAGNGTSFSAPFVSGVAAMLKTIKPEASNQQIIQILQQSASNFNITKKQWNPFYGYGILNMSDAVELLLNPQFAPGAVGSFYGQVITSSGLSIGDVIIIAVNNNPRPGTEALERIYTTKFIADDPATIDGMFRLVNLPLGNYSIYYDSRSPQNLLIPSLDVVRGADVYLQLVIPF
ncbi:S8 family peptidase [Bacillus toyonensis]|uniref:Peptidase S8/S53 domain-containing protein n=1 Tax=Bacillus toyonensis TaxID=155322 RepID=A0A2A8H847_9BACI|nr:S8 family serine peptidase [Bacillus toyonensis]PEP93144.1 hypothetical protein CN585_27125 [Bacillus toyonensis]